MATVKENKIVRLSDSAYIKATYRPHQCPVSKLDFIGSCPNTNCPANISERRSNSSGCFFEQGKANIVDVARALRITTHEVKRRYNNGIKKLERFTQFYNWLQNQRELYKYKACPKCGVHKEHTLECANGKRCDRRQKLFQIATQRFPFNVIPLNVQASEFWAVVADEELRKLLLSRWLQTKTLNAIEKLNN